ncbi:hypothetical protein ASG31_17170 [Chryseobacterium sp. Leaf404]|nr:hypothetical protein ASG31_17170 [Chryseobacterium sp. Leaf404]
MFSFVPIFKIFNFGFCAFIFCFCQQIIFQYNALPTMPNSESTSGKNNFRISALSRQNYQFLFFSPSFETEP